MSQIQIMVAANEAEARSAMAQGYEGKNESPVCRKALNTPVDAARKYVVSGVPTADASLAIAITSASLGCISSDSIVLRIVDLVASARTGAWNDLTQEGRAGAIVLAWHARQRKREANPYGAHETGEQMAVWWACAVNDWAELLAARDDDGPTVEMRNAREAEAERIRIARQAVFSVMTLCECVNEWELTPASSSKWSDGIRRIATEGAPHRDCKLTGWKTSNVALIECNIMAPNVWYADHPELRGYVAYWEHHDTSTMCISLRPKTAQDEGLRFLIPCLPWGIGGIPELLLGSGCGKLTRYDAERALRLLAERIDEVTQ